MPRVQIDGAGTSATLASKYATSVFAAPPPKAVAKSRSMGAAPTSEDMLVRLLSEITDVTARLGRVLDAKVAPGEADRTVVALAVNRGVLDIVANFLCSARHNLPGGDALVRTRVVAFSADAETARALGPSVAATRAGKGCDVGQLQTAPISVVFHSFRLMFGRASKSRNGLEA